jgi:hypothetical protein
MQSLQPAPGVPVTARTLSAIWASGILVGSGIYLVFDSFGIGKHAIGDGILLGAIAVGIMLALEKKLQ